MPSAFDIAFAQVQQLVADFKANETFYLSPQFSEAQARKDFIDKFFVALGWDVNHDTQKNPYEQEVKIERNESLSQRRADYAFFLKPNFRDVQFFVEAKKPHGEFGSPDNYFQSLRYGWGSKTSFVVLTNFEELHILDCRYKPHIDDTLSRVFKRFTYADYADTEKFAEIYWLFSHEAVANNSLAKEAAKLPKPKSKTFRRDLFKGGYQSLDDSFLIELDSYREMLAKAFKSKNPDLKSEQLTEVTQRTLDRLVFIRFLEDKLIEPQRRIERFGADGGSAWKDFVDVSNNLDRIYNGVVFKRHEILDAPGFQLDEKPFRVICDELSDATSPYNFDAIPIHILGSIYERFLGKIITDAARVEEKPEVRKAGGVYYTPEYIVRYIVANTVGKLIEGKTPAEISAMHFADIACGSGSFLLEVFDCLLRYHTKFYNEHPGKVKKGDCIKRDDGLHLSLKKKQEILQNNIYGVDIDRQAVEVAQLSLYLKLLEDETPASAHAFQTEFHYTLLPPLTENIICGNSLIGTDILDDGKFTPEEERKLNPMDFEQRFPKIFRRKTSGGELHDAVSSDSDYTQPGVPLHGAYAKVSYRKKKEEKTVAIPKVEYEGGFDAIVGNPPYRMLQPHNTDALVLAYLRNHYVAADFKIELFHLFLQRAVSLVKSGGFESYIVPTTILNNVYAEAMRKWLMEKCCIEQIAVAPGRIFVDADVHTSVLVLRRESDNEKRRRNLVLTTTKLGQEFVANPDFVTRTAQQTLSALPGCVWNVLVNEQNNSLISRLRKEFSALKTIATLNRGLITGDREKYFSPIKKTKEYFPIIAGSDVHRYFCKQPSEFVLFKRPDTAGGCWDKDVHFAQHKLVVRQICEQPTASILRVPFAVTGNIFTVRGTSLKDELFLLGILNSRLIAFFWKTMFADFKDSFPQVTIFSLEQLPICVPKPADKARHDRIVSLVEKMLEAKKQSSTALTDGDKDFYGNKCATLDRQIDALVYELYGLTEEEIKIVEGTEK